MEDSDSKATESRKSSMTNEGDSQKSSLVDPLPEPRPVEGENGVTVAPAPVATVAPPRAEISRHVSVGRNWKKEAYEQAPTKIAPPVIKPVSGTYPGPLVVDIVCTTGSVQVYYTTNGSFPSTSSAKYDPLVPLELPSGAVTIRAIAIYKNNLLESRIASATYNVQ